ncbi:hypothetical protein V7S43_008547 [Phytophthora oleae]|uniref:Uncharacterized protein n=1 Tax=Phytophthora oleae TaxID=2107226 RepID=A0ABD3FKP4_9STRA
MRSPRCSTSSLSGVDAFGIPLEISHFRSQNCGHERWGVGHVLEMQYTKRNGNDIEFFTHICVFVWPKTHEQPLCCTKFMGGRCAPLATHFEREKAHDISA